MVSINTNIFYYRFEMVQFGNGRLIRENQTANRTGSEKIIWNRSDLNSSTLSNGDTVFWNTENLNETSAPPGNPGDDPVRARQQQIDKQLGIDRDANATQFVPSEEPGDRRIRLRPKTRRAWDVIFGKYEEGDDNILSILHPKAGRTNGVVFPYTPAITYTYIAEWQPYNLVHTNYQTNAYSKSMVDKIVISGAFTAQNIEEAKYSYAVIHFFRTVTKMYYGAQDVGTEDNPGLAGTPPPVLLLSGYGNGIFNDIPVVVDSFSHELLNDSDYVPVTFRRNSVEAWVPSQFNIILSLTVQHNLTRVRNEFKLDDFRTGKLLSNNKGFL